MALDSRRTITKNNTNDCKHVTTVTTDEKVKIKKRIQSYGYKIISPSAPHVNKRVAKVFVPTQHLTKVNLAQLKPQRDTSVRCGLDNPHNKAIELTQ